jgi:tetratricopeptide (TPR) repeat protein
MQRWGQLNSCLENLVGLDLIRAKRRSPSMQYRFKHVMIREVVYDGILKSERKAIHACIASCIENLFCEQLPEHFETLAYHFKQAGAIDKAITYLMHSGRKSLRRYAVEEAHRYYREAFDLIKGLEECDSNKEQRLVEALANWLPVYYYRGRFGPAEKRMSAYLHQAHAIEDSELRGVYYIGYGMCLWARERFQDAYEYMHRALKIGQAISSLSVEGYAHAWLTWVCIELGLPEESLAHGRAARALAEHFDSGHYPYYRSFDSDGFAHMLTGDCNRIMACSRALFEYGKASSSGRVTTWASFIKGLGQITGGSFKAATDSIREALSTSADPLYTMFPKLFLAIAFFSNGNYRSSREPLQEILDHGRRYGCEFISTPAAFFMSLSPMHRRQHEKKFAKHQKNDPPLGKKWCTVAYCMGRGCPGRVLPEPEAEGDLLAAIRHSAQPAFSDGGGPFGRPQHRVPLQPCNHHGRESGRKGHAGTGLPGLGTPFPSAGPTAQGHRCHWPVPCPF